MLNSCAHQIGQKSYSVLGVRRARSRLAGRYAATLVACMMLAGSFAFSQNPPLPRAPGAIISTLNPRPGFFTEPSVAVNPRNPRQVIVAFQNQASIAYSSDSGNHWRLAKSTAPKNYIYSGDVSVTYDNQGHAFLCYIAFDQLGTYSYWAHGATRNGIYVRRSLDGGRTWASKDVPVAEDATAPGIPFEDKPYLVADQNSGTAAGDLYVGWTRWTLTDSRMMFSRSSDDGETWSRPVEIDNHPGLPRDDNGALEGFDGVVGPDGTLYVIWSDGNHIVLTVSHDRGQTFDTPRNIIRTAPDFFQVVDVDRSDGMPQIGIDPRGGGKLYITWSDYRNGDVDVFCSNSSDGGKTWTAAVRVNSDPIHDGEDQYFQWLAVDPVSGAVNVMFYDRRVDPENRRQIVVLARSTDGGRSFANYAWTVKPFDAHGIFIGDYTGLAAFGGRVYGAWTTTPPAAGAAARGKHGKREKALNSKQPFMKTRGTVIQVGIADFGAPGNQAEIVPRTVRPDLRGRDRLRGSSKAAD